jgi:hypothetical protein
MRQDELTRTKEALLSTIIEIRDSGLVAPVGVSISPYSVSRPRKDGSSKEFHYFKLECDRPIFDGKNGKTKYLHLGKAGSEAHRDWKTRIARRKSIAAIEALLSELTEQDGDCL